jgi:hypothetical protein
MLWDCEGVAALLLILVGAAIAAETRGLGMPRA